MLLLVGAGVANLPLVYMVLERMPDAPPPLVLSVGLLSMGLSWAGGCAIQERRPGSVVAIAALGVAEALVPLVPGAREALGVHALVWPLLAAAFSAAALIVRHRAASAAAPARRA